VIRLHKRSLVSTVCFLDPAGGKATQDKSKARSAIVGISMDPANRVFVRKIWAERCSTERMYQKIYEFNEELRPSIFGIEANAQQSLFADSVIKDAKEKRIDVPVAHVVHPTNINKDFRIRAYIQPLVSEGRLFMIKEEHLELFKEITAFPMSRLKDVIDALASAISLLPRFYSIDEFGDEQKELLKYLRDSGAPASYIEQKARELAPKGPSEHTLESYIELIKS